MKKRQEYNVFLQFAFPHRLSLKEFAAHREIAEALGIDVFFAHPYHSWERGTNENMNGLIRQYIPQEIIIRKPQRRRYSIDTE